MVLECLQALTLRVEALEKSNCPSNNEKQLLFNFEHIRRKDVYLEIVRLYDKHWFDCVPQELIQFLSRHTNLGEESTVKSQFYKYLREYYGRE